MYLNESKVEFGNCKDIMPRYTGGQFNLIITSPPYYNQRDCATGGEQLDGTYPNIEAYFADMRLILSECIRLAAPGAIFAINIGNDPTYYLPGWWAKEMMAKDLKFIDCIAWVKGTGNMTRRFHIEAKNIYYPQIVWEPVLIFQKSRETGFDDKGFPKFEERFTYLASKLYGTNVWEIPQDNEASWHPAPYPRKLATNLISLYSEPNSRILDPFSGGGTTAVAVDEVGNGRKYLVCELIQSHYENSLKRINSNEVGFL